MLKILLLGLIVSLQTVNSIADEGNSLFASGSRFDIEWRGKYSDAEKTKLKQWLAHAAKSTAMLYGNLPRNPIRIIMKRRDKANKPVPFAQVLRSEPQGISFLVNPEFELQAFIDDWTAVHELSHLYIPYPGGKDIWLSEGLATYYQNVLMARAGVLSERQAWQKLYEGFMRGEADNRYPQYSLLELSPRMIATRSFMRIYWSGTAYFLQADLQLRQQTSNKQSLDTVIEQFVDCCLLQANDYNGEDLVRKFDHIAQVDLFYPLYKHYQQLTEQPSTVELFSQLGITVNSGKVQLLALPQNTLSLRQAIMQTKNALSSVADN
ncbi:hypothetical protein [Oceanicoccus sp. KOV_DT_Chl]|uniref:M61 family metallopeptidase n=1 Tax=Oceanicoccus sp. KOV_DT_Chl TaxID=1904639 RepID=UPI000C7AFB3F|nr:hypothetical protein [Oceanicoccus sp. KOV_DT_Chl]